MKTSIYKNDYEFYSLKALIYMQTSIYKKYDAYYTFVALFYLKDKNVINEMLSLIATSEEEEYVHYISEAIGNMKSLSIASTIEKLILDKSIPIVNRYYLARIACNQGYSRLLGLIMNFINSIYSLSDEEFLEQSGDYSINQTHCLLEDLVLNDVVNLINTNSDQIPLLINLLSDSQINFEIKRRIAATLSKIDFTFLELSKIETKVLKLILDKEIHPSIRSQLIKILIKSKNVTTINTLIDICQDEEEHYWVRGLIISKFPVIIPFPEINILYSILENKNVPYYVWAETILVLGELGIDYSPNCIVEIYLHYKEDDYSPILDNCLKQMKSRNDVATLLSIYNRDNSVLGNISSTISEIDIEKSKTNINQLIFDDKIDFGLRLDLAFCAFKKDSKNNCLSIINYFYSQMYNDEINFSNFNNNNDIETRFALFLTKLSKITTYDLITIFLNKNNINENLTGLIIKVSYLEENITPSEEQLLKFIKTKSSSDEVKRQSISLLGTINSIQAIELIYKNIKREKSTNNSERVFSSNEGISSLKNLATHFKIPIPKNEDEFQKVWQSLAVN